MSDEDAGEAPAVALPARSGAGSRIEDYIDAAAALFAAQGYDRTTVRDIARAMGMTSGSMFFHFKSKQELLESVVAKGVRDGLTMVETALRATPGTALQRLRALVRAHLGIAHGPLHAVHRVWYREWANLPPDARERLHPWTEAYRRIWNEALLALQAEGYVRSDPAILRHMLLPALNWTIYWVEDASEAALAELCDQICATALNLSLAEFRGMAETPLSPGSERLLSLPSGPR